MKLKKEVKIGLFAVAMLLCLYLGINYLKGREVFSGDRAYYTLFDQTNGLQKSSSVLLRGVKIGSVADISIDPAHPEQVLVTVVIKNSVRIPDDSRLEMFSDGIMGSRAIRLLVGTSPTYFEKHDMIPSQIESGFLDYASVSINDILGEVKRVVNSLDAAAGSLDAILVANAEGLRGTMNNLRSVTGQLAASDLRGTFADLRGFASMLHDNSARFDSIIGNFSAVSGSLAAADLEGTVNSLGMSIDELHAILQKASSGDGTIGRLLDDRALYDSVVVAVGDLSRLIEDIKAHPKRYINVSVFGGRNKD